MKKLYAFALAAAIALGASAASKSMRVDAAALAPATLSTEKITIAEKGASLPIDVDRISRLSKAPSRVSSARDLDIEGDYFDLYDDGVDMVGDRVVITKKPSLGGMGASSKYYIANIYGSFFGKTGSVEGTFSDVEFPDVTGGTITFPTLTIEPGQQLLNINGMPFNLYMTAIGETGKVTFYVEQPIQLIYNEEEGTFFLPYSAGVYLGAWCPLNYAGYSSEYLNSFYSPNGQMSFTEINWISDEEYEEIGREVSVYAHQSDENLYIVGFCDAPYACIFDLDLEHGVATAIDQTAIVMYDNDSNEYVFSWQSVPERDEDTSDVYVFSADLANNDDGTSSLTVPGDIWAFNYELESYMMFYVWDVNCTFDFQIEGLASVADIAVDSNVGAPVEYFNLQGVRVAQPAPGQIVIRRQGTDVSKTVVR